MIHQFIKGEEGRYFSDGGCSNHYSKQGKRIASIKFTITHWTF